MDYRSLNTEDLRTKREQLVAQADENATAFRSTGNREALSTHSGITREVERIDSELHQRGQFHTRGAGGNWKSPRPVGDLLGRIPGRQDERGGLEGVRSGNNEARQAMFRYLTDGPDSRDSGLYDQAMQRASLSTQSGAVGGYIVPEFVSVQVEQDLSALDTVRRLGAPIMPVQGKFNLPLINDPTAAFLSESTATSTGIPASDPTLSQIEIRPELVAAQTAYSWHVQAFSPANVEEEISRSFGRSIGKKAAEKFLIGSGSNQPQGLAVGAGVGVVAEATTEFTGADINTLWYSLAPEFQATAAWIISPAAAVLLRTLETEGGQPLWLQSLALGAQTLHGRPVVIDPHMGGLEAGATPIVLASVPDCYVIAESPLFLVNDPFSLATAAQNRVVAYRFVDGRVKRAAAAKKLVMASGL